MIPYTAMYYTLEENQREETKGMVTVAILSVKASRCRWFYHWHT